MHSDVTMFTSEIINSPVSCNIAMAKKVHFIQSLVEFFVFLLLLFCLFCFIFVVVLFCFDFLFSNPSLNDTTW